MGADDLKLPAGNVSSERKMPLDFHIRVLREGDETPLAAFYAGLSVGSRYFFEPYADISVAAMRAVVCRAISGKDLSLVAVVDGEVLAHIFYRDVSQAIPHLGIGISDAYQDFGLGSVLLCYLISLGRHVLKKETIGLTVVKENARAQHVYAKHGFRIVGDATFRSPNDSHVMELDFHGTADCPGSPDR